ncbi:IgGFc-binding protein [Nannocystis pusilla]|uniref:IgGFc-binding protein n=1 Tax=Nannocystis pusilla TaxID=889268 RepID=A0ABS7TZV1_9BACT|nr:IgGFc-binding protein [Nannocystis pusilla]
MGCERAHLVEWPDRDGDVPEYWGVTYVGAHAPLRAGEKHYWRVYAAEDDTTVTTTPALPGTPFALDRGQWKELVVANGTSVIFTGNRPFLPVQYLESQHYEVADWQIAEGPHLAESAQPFGLVNVGYDEATSYAYPGGTRLKVINPQ